MRLVGIMLLVYVTEDHKENVTENISETVATGIMGTMVRNHVHHASVFTSKAVTHWGAGKYCYWKTITSIYMTL